MSLRSSFYRALFVLTHDQPVDPDYIARKLDVLSSTAKRYLKELIKLGYVREVSEGKYVLTKNGVLLKESILAHIREQGSGSPYYFTDPKSSQPVPLVIRDLMQLYVILKYNIIDWSILEYHVKAGYLSKWIRDSLGDIELANKIDEVKESINKDTLLKLMEDRLRIIDIAKNLKVSE